MTGEDTSESVNGLGASEVWWRQGRWKTKSEEGGEEHMEEVEKSYVATVPNIHELIKRSHLAPLSFFTQASFVAMVVWY
jgi:hypothetical protein